MLVYDFSSSSSTMHLHTFPYHPENPMFERVELQMQL